MTEPTLNNKYSHSTVIKAIELLNDAKASADDVAKICDPEILQLANETTPSQLDAGDLFIALVNEYNSSPESVSKTEEALREKLMLPAADPQNAHLSFGYVRSGKHIIAAVKITPEEIADAKPDVFAGGLFHTAGMYFAGALKYTELEKRPIVLIDTYGNGASCADSSEIIHFDELVEDTTKAVVSAGENGIRYLMGHSLGSIVVRSLYIDMKKRGAAPVAEKYIPITMVPAGAERLAGFKMNRCFSMEEAPNILFREQLRPSYGDYFFDGHPDDEKIWLQNFVDSQSLNTNLFGFAGVLAEIADRSLLDYIGERDLIVVFSDSDSLMELHGDKEKWKRRGVVFLQNADHSAIAGKSYAEENWAELSRELSNFDEAAQKINPDELALHPFINAGAVLQGGLTTSAGKINFSGGAGLTVEAGIGLKLGLQLIAEGGLFFDFENLAAFPLTFETGLRLYPDISGDLSLSLLAGSGINLGTGTHSLYVGPKLEADYNFFDICKLFVWSGAEIFIETGATFFSAGAGLKL